MQRIIFIPIENNQVFNSSMQMDLSKYPYFPIIWKCNYGYSAYYLKDICHTLTASKLFPANQTIKPIIQTDYALYAGFPYYDKIMNSNLTFHQGFILSNQVCTERYVRHLASSDIVHLNYPLCDYSDRYSGSSPIAGFNSGSLKILFFLNSYINRLKILIFYKNKISHASIYLSHSSKLYDIESVSNGIILHLLHISYLITIDGKVLPIYNNNIKQSANDFNSLSLEIYRHIGKCGTGYTIDSIRQLGNVGDVFFYLFTQESEVDSILFNTGQLIISHLPIAVEKWKSLIPKIPPSCYNNYQSSGILEI